MESWRTYKSRSNPLEIEPGGILRWGSTFLFIIFLMTIFTTSLIPFNQVVKGTVTVTSKNPPVEIKVKRAGKLAVINYQPRDSITAGDIIAILENTGSSGDMAYLKQQLLKDLSETISFESLVTEFPADLNLGNAVQPAYNRFLEEYQKSILENLFNDNEVMKEQLIENIIDQVSISKSKEAELSLMDNGLTISNKNIERHRKLFSKGVISQADLEKVELEHAEKKRQYVVLNQQILQLNAERRRISSSLEILQNSGLKELNKNKAELNFARQNLLNSIIQWEDENTIKSPIEGRLTYNEVWTEHQSVEEGEVVFTVVPYNRNGFVAKCSVPVKNVGQIRNGQDVYLKLDNYPYRDWGMVKAKVNTISQVPHRENIPSYTIYLNLENLITSYGEELVFSQELIGTAEILLHKVTLLERIFYQFRDIWAT